MIITADLVASVQRDVGTEEVWVSNYFNVGHKRENEGFNVLCGNRSGRPDEVGLDHLIDKDVPAAENGMAVLAIDPGGYAWIGPNGEYLGIEKELTHETHS